MAVTTQAQPILNALPPVSGRAGLGGTLRSEFTKIRSVRSTYWTLLVLLVVSVGIGAAGGTPLACCAVRRACSWRSV